MLQRKREALLLLAKDLEKCMRERDQLRAFVKKFVSTCVCSAGTVLQTEFAVTNSYPEDTNQQQSDLYPGASNERDLEIRRQKNIITELIKQKRELNEEVKQLRDKVDEAYEDIKLLRETVARQRVGSSSTIKNSSSSVLNESFCCHSSNTRIEELISELETVKLRNESLENELFTYREQNREQNNEKEFYVNRSERLNAELNHILSGDSERTIVDIDALALENNHLKSQLAQVQCEKSILKEHYLKLKQINSKPNLKNKKPDKSLFKVVSQKTANGAEVGDSDCRQFLSTKDVEQYLMRSPGKTFPVNAKTVEELHALALSLTETIEEKNMALSHQKNTNKALGARVTELENKLKSIEGVSWHAVRDREEALMSFKDAFAGSADLQNKNNHTSYSISDCDWLKSHSTNKSQSSGCNYPSNGLSAKSAQSQSSATEKESSDWLKNVGVEHFQSTEICENGESFMGPKNQCIVNDDSVDCVQSDSSVVMSSNLSMDGRDAPSNEQTPSTKAKDPVFEKFFSGIDSQLSKEEEQVGDQVLEEINLND